MFCPYGQLVDDELGFFSEMLYIHTIDIETLRPIYDGKLGYFSELPDVHTLNIWIFVPYAQISDG